MEKKIYKYALEKTATQQIEMPQGAQILCIQTQNDTPCIWALVNPSAMKVRRPFAIMGTGHSVPEQYTRNYIGTCQVMGGDLVLHCFEILGT